MPRLPHTVDFDERTFPELRDVFRSIDAAIAAIVASDPAMRPRPAQKRRPHRGQGDAARRNGGTPRRKAA